MGKKVGELLGRWLVGEEPFVGTSGVTFPPFRVNI